ncbi:IPT/TIG domain-containing protein [Chitinophaga horti]|uniref:IPT/TIG domain-containing protein n=1 Tax=Chitinophaga horti TaxID=2920382 RepID=A0ABY6J5P3_9BACT|nr:IPT/TIG domain-containing protein [Chitinophaga horti]UYQ93626.1 IPT/TIG domain-containing protein [Chitinophaga horti]
MRKLLPLLLVATIAACKKDKDKDPGQQPVPVPEITSFNPTHGIPGAEVTITGKNFANNANGNRVTFNTTVATVTSFSPTQLKVTVPAGATTGKLKVTVGLQTGTSVTDFVVDPIGPAITDFTPKEGPFGTVVTITGRDFGTDPIVRVGLNPIDVISKSATEIKVKVPSLNNLTTFKFNVQVGATGLQTASDFTVKNTGVLAEWVNKPINSAPAGIFFNGVSFAYNKKLYWGFTKLTQGETQAGYMTCDPAAATPQWIFQFVPANMMGPDHTSATAAVHGGKVYIGSGLDGNATAKWWRFNPDNNTADVLPDLPVATASSLSFTLNDVLYTGFGGVNKDLYKFDAAGNGSWTKVLTGNFRELTRANALVINNDVFVGPALIDLNGTRHGMFRFTAPNTLVRVTDIPEPAVGLSTPAFALNGKAYFIIGAKTWEYTPDASGGTWRLVIDGTGNLIISFVNVIDGVPYGITSGGRLFEFKFKP